MNAHKKVVSLAAVIVLALGFESASAANFADGTITVTPSVTVDLSLSPASYAFGTLAVGSSSNSATALSLSNGGNVDISVDKRIQSDPSGWTAGTAAGANVYVLSAATAAARPGLTDFASGTAFGAALSVSSLTGSSGTGSNVTLSAPGGSAKLWFKLDMPSGVSEGSGKTITVRFTATAL